MGRQGVEDGWGRQGVDDGDRYGCSVKVPSCDAIFVMMSMHGYAIVVMVDWTGVSFDMPIGVHVL